MADKPICIITPEGMKCLSSPLKKHFPGAKACVEAATPGHVQKAADKACSEVGKALSSVKTTRRVGGASRRVRAVSKTKEMQIRRLVRLVIESRANLNKPFTIVRA